MINEILVPRDNANDEEVIVVSNIANGTNVISNKTVILELEGSKTVYEYRAETSGNVKIGNTNRFGTGIFIEPFLEIGNTCIISSGSIITTNISNNSTVKLISKQRIA